MTFFISTLFKNKISGFETIIIIRKYTYMQFFHFIILKIIYKP
jgi:hypothetical protein